ncbi:hypothetical protein [Terrabacter sp. MAHUQ-38]|jgi:hypothetical protein|uniref:hypothetical protein n=1 Tax=unclassified Terrabacter TaxID=2630222 RepID=UPI001CAA6393|nr:hypothetical protein [Terrabacter sp. MAHUQ-38]
MTSPASTTKTTPTDGAASAEQPTGGQPTIAEPGGTPASEPPDRPASQPTDRAAAKAEKGRPSPDLRAGARRAASLTRTGVARVRTVLGELVWLACLLAATALLLGAVLVVLEANTSNALVEAVLRAADWADLGVFSRDAGVKQFTGEGAVVRNAVVNWGLGALAWLVAGRIARRILTP